MKRWASTVLIAGISALLLWTLPGARMAIGALARALAQFLTGGAR
jgi:hypothetical protein